MRTHRGGKPILSRTDVPVMASAAPPGCGGSQVVEKHGEQQDEADVLDGALARLADEGGVQAAEAGVEHEDPPGLAWSARMADAVSHRRLRRSV